MLKRVLLALPFLLLAFFILTISAFKAAAVKYEFGGCTTVNNVLGVEDVEVDYLLAFPGKIHPDSWLWPIKAMRDKIWLAITTDPGKKAELKLLFADKRLGSAKVLFDKGKPEIAYTALTKAEKYLEEAEVMELENRKAGNDTTEFCVRLANASLKHFHDINDMQNIAPDDARPKLIELQNYSKRVYEQARNCLLEKQKSPPENPYDWK